MNRRGQGYAPTDLLCFWCGKPSAGTPYRSPITDVPGGRYVVCSPTCVEKPEGALVFPDRRAL